MLDAGADPNSRAAEPWVSPEYGAFSLEDGVGETLLHLVTSLQGVADTESAHSILGI